MPYAETVIETIRQTIESQNVSINVVERSESTIRIEMVSAAATRYFQIRLPDEVDSITDELLVYKLVESVQLVEDTTDFLGWVDELDLDAANPAALNLYRDLVETADGLHWIFGTEAYQGLLGQLAIQQAIGRARASFNQIRKGNNS